MVQSLLCCDCLEKQSQTKGNSLKCFLQQAMLYCSCHNSPCVVAVEVVLRMTRYTAPSLAVLGRHDSVIFLMLFRVFVDSASIWLSSYLKCTELPSCNILLSTLYWHNMNFARIKADSREGAMALFQLVLLFLAPFLSLLLNLVMHTSSSIAFLPGDENDGVRKELQPFPFPQFFTYYNTRCYFLCSF